MSQNKTGLVGKRDLYGEVGMEGRDERVGVRVDRTHYLLTQRQI